jgi:hypothetical protein
VLGPFLASNVRTKDLSLVQRVNQVSLLTGEWSGQREAIAKGADPLPIVKNNLKLSLESFVRDRIGGHGGYDFGHLAFFDTLSLYLFLAGVLAALLLVWSNVEILIVLVVIAVSFFSGIVMTIPPPAYHRFSLSYPFLALVMALPFHLFLRAPILSSLARAAITWAALLLFACINWNYFSRAAFADASSEHLRLARFVNDRYPSRKLYVAAFPGFTFEKLLYFIKKPGPPRPVLTEFHRNLLDRFERNEKYVYLIIFPDDFDPKFAAVDPNGRIFRFSPGYSVFAN